MSRAAANNTLASYRNRHEGESILVCGCGKSLNSLDIPDAVTCIGVNDIGRKLTPDYLVVLNSKAQFKGDRFSFVESSGAQAIFSQLDLGLSHPNVVRFKLGQRGGTDLSNDNILPYTRNSPYVAVCLAAFMGARRIGLIGVDFSDDHFFARSGRHPLQREVNTINREYATLARALSAAGVELCNLSPGSLVDSLPKISADAFFSPQREPATRLRRRGGASRYGGAMKIQIEKHKGELIGGFFDDLASTARALGYPVERQVTPPGNPATAVAIVWNGRRYHGQKNTIYCEHGWLPRDAYQVSPVGINADSHLAPFTWNRKVLEESERELVHRHLDALRTQDRFAQKYTSTRLQPLKGLPPEFLLVPLQLEQDTNILRHVSPKLRRMQAVVDYISCSNPPYPVIYKQHPADPKKGDRHMRLKMRRKQDMLKPHHQGNIHQILKTGSCTAILSLNSNVVHDGFLWQVPSIVLGRNIWPQEGVSPFMHGLPLDWSELDTFYGDATVTACREAYIHRIVRQQWYREDASNPEKVEHILQQKIAELQRSVAGRRYAGGELVNLPPHKPLQAGRRRLVRNKSRLTTANVVARNKGWLFEDLKQAFAQVRLPDIRVLVSDKPKSEADAWLYLRASEIAGSPDRSRTLVQIHDLFDDGAYAVNGNRRDVGECAALSFTHTGQQAILEANGIDLSTRTLITMPMGAGRDFKLRQRPPKRFTVGWIGRPVSYQGRDFKRLEWFYQGLESAALGDSVLVALIGDRLQQLHRRLLESGYDSHCYPRSRYQYRHYPALYEKLDCVVITSEFAAGPNCLYEALATGLPVISTPCGWAGKLLLDGENGFLVNSPAEIGEAIRRIHDSREYWFSRQHAIRASLQGFAMDNWLRRNLEAAAGLARARSTGKAKSATG